MLLVSAGVLAMLFARAEGRDFQLPGGDGLIVMIAGGWAALLIFYRLLDKPGLQGNAAITATVGVEWGIFIALLLALAPALHRPAHARRRARQPPLTRPRERPGETPATRRDRDREETIVRCAEDDDRTRPRRAGERERPAAVGRVPARPSATPAARAAAPLARPRPAQPRRRHASRADARATRRRRPSRCPSRTRRRPTSSRPLASASRPAPIIALTMPASPPEAPQQDLPAPSSVQDDRRRDCARRATCPASRPRSSPTWRRSSASRCSSRGRRASARPSWPRRSRRYLGRELVRLQCYEGLDEAKALYEWNYRKQLLRIQAEAAGTGWERRAGGHLRRGVPARAAADDGDRLRAAGRAADRRDRQDRPGVRGDAARGALRLPDLDPRARARASRARTRSCCSPRTTRAS